MWTPLPTSLKPSYCSVSEKCLRKWAGLSNNSLGSIGWIKDEIAAWPDCYYRDGNGIVILSGSFLPSDELVQHPIAPISII